MRYWGTDTCGQFNQGHSGVQGSRLLYMGPVSPARLDALQWDVRFWHEWTSVSLKPQRFDSWPDRDREVEMRFRLFANAFRNITKYFDTFLFPSFFYYHSNILKSFSDTLTFCVFMNKLWCFVVFDWDRFAELHVQRNSDLFQGVHRSCGVILSTWKKLKF